MQGRISFSFIRSLSAEQTSERCGRMERMREGSEGRSRRSTHVQLSGLTMKRFDETLDEHLTSLEERLGLGHLEALGSSWQPVLTRNVVLKQCIRTVLTCGGFRSQVL